MDGKEFNSLLTTFNDIRKAWATVYGAIVKYKVTQGASKVDVLNKVKEAGKDFLNKYSSIFDKVEKSIAKVKDEILVLKDKTDEVSTQQYKRALMQLPILEKMEKDKGIYFQKLSEVNV